MLSPFHYFPTAIYFFICSFHVFLFSTLTCLSTTVRLSFPVLFLCIFLFFSYAIYFPFHFSVSIYLRSFILFISMLFFLFRLFLTPYKTFLYPLINSLLLCLLLSFPLIAFGFAPPFKFIPLLLFYMFFVLAAYYLFPSFCNCFVLSFSFCRLSFLYFFLLVPVVFLFIIRSLLRFRPLYYMISPLLSLYIHFRINIYQSLISSLSVSPPPVCSHSSHSLFLSHTNSQRTTLFVFSFPYTVYIFPTNIYFSLISNFVHHIV